MSKKPAWSSQFPALFVFLCALCSPIDGHTYDFGVDPNSPEVPNNRSPSDIYDWSGSNVVFKAVHLGVGPLINIDAFSYGEDQLDPFDAPFFYVTITYSVSRDTVGLAADGYPFSGAVFRQAQGNGAAGDKFYLKAVDIFPPIGMWPISRGLMSDAPMHNLTALDPNDATVEQSDLDSMSAWQRMNGKPVYFSTDGN